MPWTFAHPAAVLPLARWAPKYLNLPALVCGSLAPDVLYYADEFEVAGYAHTAVGSVVAGLPLGLLCLLFFYLLRRPLWFLLPQPHRSAVAPLLESTPWRGKWFWLVAIVSTLIGVWTHNIWDSFTHYNGWMVLRIPLLWDWTLWVGNRALQAHRVLQLLSSALGALVLVLAYFSWLRRQPRSRAQLRDRGELFRYGALAGAALVSVAVAFPFAHDAALDLSYYGHLSYEMLASQLLIRAGTVFALIVLLYSAVYGVVARNADAPERRPRDSG
jgi:hypothetical protein